MEVKLVMFFLVNIALFMAFIAGVMFLSYHIGKFDARMMAVESREKE